MVLKTQKGSEIPEGAVPLSSKEALEYQWTFIKNWPSEAEVLSIKFGRHIASATTFLSSVYIMNFFRKTLNINKVRFVVASMPGVGIPTIVSYYLTDRQITNSVLLMKLRCPLCDQLYFGASQLYTSVIFPAFYGYFSLSAFASFTKSYPVPSFDTHPREFWKFGLQMVKQGIPHYRVVAIAQTLLILLLPEFQKRQLINVINKTNQNDSESLDNALELQY